MLSKGQTRNLHALAAEFRLRGDIKSAIEVESLLYGDAPATHHSASERIFKDEDSVDARIAAGMATAISAHAKAGSPAKCRHVRRVLEDEDGVTVQTVCWPVGVSV